MLCTACGGSFSFFKKQHSCVVCGFIFCRKCCSNKIVVPSVHPQQKQNLCKKCFNQLTSTSQAPVCPPSPPAAFKKRLEQSDAILNPKGSPKIPNRTEHAQGSQEKEVKYVPQSNYIEAAKLGPTEQELRERLSKLKHVGPTHMAQNPISVPTEKELSERLSKLKRVESRPLPPMPEQQVQPSYLLSEKKVSECEEASRLVQQFQEEVALDARRPPPEKEVEDRLRKLREDWPLDQPLPPPPPVPPLHVDDALKDDNLENGTSDSDTESDSGSEKTAKEVNAVMQKFLAQAEDQYKNDHESEDCASSQEFVTCAMCSSVATTECLDCDCDLYCSKCYKNWHRDEESRNHRSVPYKQSQVY